MTIDADAFLATRRLRIGDSDVHVTIGMPHRRGSTEDVQYCCNIAIDGLSTDPVRLQAISPSVGQTLEIALSAVTQRLDVGVNDFLADAHLGSPARTR
ncbi:hypothetical protein [Nocardia terpenica]|uniref:hypothetical protein n=1 Tax=Nocardia terpenica TaxID=455432 RepID=UPI0012FE0605|nr:hypothetical protein [Nocardia terpenica]